MRNPFVFAMMICVVCSVGLSITRTLLKERQDKNEEVDRKKNVLMALDLYSKDKPLTDEEVENTYLNKIDGYLIDKTGKRIDGDLSEAVHGGDKMVVFERKDNGYIAMPVQGMGLWSILYGYFALKEDRKTVAGITFYKHGETPGLGAEITADWFTSSFPNKSIVNSKGELVGVIVAKGKASDMPGVELINAVDGISGATMTGRGVTDLLKKGIDDYKPYLAKKW